ncbi:hypothetical protein EJ02DRAFT_371044 [Clathrospora elynae]|uniref:Protein artemis n=1 Tax=Clathrospora elynae TaxID=706981 RepID=A0A6A5SVD4_9PLEO|nr:hypothetical protein EJ02DRAFT_371044 [Clathrospora elynae]
MSTFKGIVAEFPQIRIDYFRQQPEHKAPLACFLSHVHSDHLAGLESLGTPFVYCSAATKEILLRLEKYHYRINFAKGLLESQNLTYDRSMRKLAKPLPLDTPTTIELAPGKSMQVTLVDANHCVGAVMFLIEGNGNAILYTGDIRAENWWVNSLVQNPVLLPYTLETRRLNCMYLDTTFATKKESYREFPSKAEGTRELLSKVSEYPDDTIFYFHSWTFGYENVWLALSNFIGSQIHLDDYRARIYGSLSTLGKRQLRVAGLDVSADNKSLRESGLEIREAPALCGFKNGNHIQPGCLTSREDVRIHSCERGMGCQVMDRDAHAKTVHIIPIITRAEGVELSELGAGGGKGDLDQKEELETGGVAEMGKLMKLCAASIEDEQLLAKVLALLQQTLARDGKLGLDMQLQKQSQDVQDDLPLQTLVSVLSSHATKNQEAEPPRNQTIRFPYSLHSSYSELCGLVEAFKPIDIFPCTVDDASWTPVVSMRNLFGDLCSKNVFRHDAEMMKLYGVRLAFESRVKRDRPDTQRDSQTTEEETVSPAPKRIRLEGASLESEQFVTSNATLDNPTRIGRARVSSTLPALTAPTVAVLESVEHAPAVEAATGANTDDPPLVTPILIAATIASGPPILTVAPPSIKDTTIPSSHKGRRPKFTNQQIAYQAAIGNCGLSWSDYGGLVSTRSKADQEEEEL